MKTSILILHPHAEMLKKLRLVLVQAGYAVFTATDLPTARAIMDKMKVDMVMCPPSQKVLEGLKDE